MQWTPTLNKKREWLSIYNQKTCAYWNGIIWNEIINDKNIKGKGIDRNVFYNYIKDVCNDEVKSNILFSKINIKSKSINLYEFEFFLELIEDNEYYDIINCLKQKNKNDYYNTILNGIVSPYDNRDIIIDNMLSQDKYNLPKEYFNKTYMPNGYIDIIKTKNIFKSFLHGSKVKPFIVNEFNSDIDDIKDYLKVKKHAEKK